LSENPIFYIEQFVVWPLLTCFCHIMSAICAAGLL